MISEILPGIFTVDHAVADGKNAIIFGPRGAWAVDAGTHAHEAQTMIDFIRAHGTPADRLIYTHGHGDHALGSAPFRGAEVIAHRLMPVECRRLLPMLAARNSLSVEEQAARVVWPTLTFSEEVTIDTGERHLRLFPTPGHSQDGISILVEEEKLLIAGDAVVTGIVPAIGDGDSRILERTLHRLLQMEIDVLVPGHGAVVRGREEVQGWLRWIADYLHNVRAAVDGLLNRGIPATEISDRLAFDDFIGARLPKDRYNMPQRHRNTVAKIVQEQTA